MRNSAIKFKNWKMKNGFFSKKNWKLKFLSFFNFQFWFEIEIPKNVLFHSNFKIKIEWHFRCTDWEQRLNKGKLKQNVLRVLIKENLLTISRPHQLKKISPIPQVLWTPKLTGWELMIWIHHLNITPSLEKCSSNSHIFSTPKMYL